MLARLGSFTLKGRLGSTRLGLLTQNRSSTRPSRVEPRAGLVSARLVGNTALNKVAASRTMLNEYDRYMSTEPSTGTTLESWKQLQPALPHLALMARDTFAVPATGAGVERQFSKSGRIDTWARNRMNPSTVCESMKYNDYLRRKGTPLISCKKRRLLSELGHLTASGGDELNDDKDEGSDTEENKIEILEWEKEWWQKVDSKLVG